MKKIILTTTIFLLLLLPGSSAAAGLEMKPLTWDVVGLSSSAPKISSGPNLFPVGAEVCNTTGGDLSDVQSSFVWDSANSYISLDGPNIDEMGALAAGECRDTFYVVQIQKTSDAWNTARQYHIETTATGASGSTPLGRQLYVERLVDQNRNATRAISGPGGCNADFTQCDPPPTELEVGREYTYKLYSETSAPHNQITTFITFPGSIFQVEEVESTYEHPSGASVRAPYADACGWQPDPALPDYLSCVGPPPAPFAPDGKAGGRVVTTYRVLVVGQGQGSLTSLINDHSGSSYHYNNDFGSLQIDFESRFPLSAEVQGSGTVVSTPPGIACGMLLTQCLATYDEGTLVLLQAAAEAGHTFLGWGGACASYGTGDTCQVLMNQAQNVTATFSGDAYYPLRVEVTAGGRVQSDVGGIDCPGVLCEKSYLEGTDVALVAEALPGYRFLRWEEDCTSDPCSVEMNGPRLVRAVFEPIQPEFHTLLFRQDDRGQATSTSDPTQSVQILCGTECLATYPEGTRVTLQVEAIPGWRLVGWGDDCAGTPVTENCVLEMTQDHIASAIYEKEIVPPPVDSSWPLDVAIEGQGTVLGSGIDCPKVLCKSTYPDGTPVSLRAEAAEGWEFSGWAGDCSPDGPLCSATMNQARSVRARFARVVPVVPDPKLRVRINVFRSKVLRGRAFRAKLVFRNINQFVALRAQPCLFLPAGVGVLGTDGGKLGEGRICWKRQDLLPGRGRKFDLKFRARRLGWKEFRARGYADNAPTVGHRDRIRVVSPTPPHPPTG